MKHAILVRGPVGVGKSTVCGIVRSQLGEVRTAIVNLDAEWDPHELRGSNRGAARWADLVDRQEEILIIELAQGEPRFCVPPQPGLGATENPREWLDLIPDRVLIAFRLDMSPEEQENRLRTRGQSRHFQRQFVEYGRSPKWTGFAQRAGIVEIGIDTTLIDAQKVAESILSKTTAALGVRDAQQVEDLLNAAATALEQAVDVRIAKCRDQFEEKYATDELKALIRQQAKGGRMVPFASFGTYDGDLLQEESCPACGCAGLLSAERWYEDEGEVDGESGVEHITAHYTSLAFRCGVCGLKLNGQEELARANIDLELEVEEERQVEYEEAYQNE